MKMLKVLFIFLLFIAGTSRISSQANSNITDTERRLALVIGNGKYLFSGELPNPVNDARAIRDALQGLGFDVYEHENLNQSQMKQAIDNFGTRLKNYTVGLFFYAGHGIQSKGSNYLIPVDANLQSEQQIEYDCVQADRVLGFMEAAGSKVNIVILDACRNNPFERSWSRAMDGSGLAFMNAPTGSLIAYSTSPGRTASDGTGSNGLYTAALLDNLKAPGLTILQMFQNVRRSVSDKSFKQQIPWESTSLTADFYFVTTAAVKEKTDVKATFMKARETGYWFYLNGEDVSTRIKSAWCEADLLIYDPITNITCLLEKYEESPKEKLLDARIVGRLTDVYWEVNKDYYWSLFVKGEDIAKRTKRVYVDNDLLVYDNETNTTYLLKDFGTSNDLKIRPGIIFDNAGFAFWRKQGTSYWLYVKGEQVQKRTKGDYFQNDLIVYDTATNISYLFRNFESDTAQLKLRPAEVLSYQDNVFWQKNDKGYFLVCKGEAIQSRTTSEWSGDDLYVTDPVANKRYILTDYANAILNQMRVALIDRSP